MRIIFGIVFLAGSANMALAHTLEGSAVTTLGHQLFGMHHLLLPVVLLAAIFYLGRSWYRSDRIK
jgi:hypothetical protein